MDHGTSLRTPLLLPDGRKQHQHNIQKKTPQPTSCEPSSNMHPDVVTREVAYTLYLCHFLSTWNARMYEFAAVVFIAASFPKEQALAASSILYVYPVSFHEFLKLVTLISCSEVY